MEGRTTPSEYELNEFIKIINEISGIDLSDKKSILALKLNKFLESISVKNFSDFLEKLKVNKQLKQETLDFVTIGETYFLRELAQLKAIIYYAKSLEKKVNILSAPCSSGEEVYSLALLAAQNFMKDIYILGIDINSNVIEKAKLGKYQGRTLQRLSENEKRRFFTENEDKFYTINKNELCLCKFELCNVFEEKFLRLGKFDIIASRNMIIYFDHESKLKLMEQFHKILNHQGRLYVGNADLIPETVYFKKVFSSKGIYYEKI
ncbi:methyltransferase domain-containing protein [Campylobacter hepaticus]|uniref:protein-glutamate O-methyltransferase n=1 Tax=Campylobacter hepaticus TaxID=1813019 RepID=A0A424YZ29_9BACT|nr:CheR family methyltransferase [Campylobacter hepaticus]AXP08555.1 methyltransferase domain-containing protein [Campylobacter hepaticus]MCZ0772394.1 methyltransferase domain-containing protein [Campylobacter hepaticus]MCZ0773862.1 methyltransferase domain-containing protein [Campylobacter hepaticus]MCZ0775113.1 methyltransferase domain-containing protein [Campylobacter hepaticus]MDX2323950.1 methyltransferase domain-containing protein [Campylobacter hepaticus]